MPIDINWNFLDAKGYPSSLTIQVPDGTALADVQAFIDVITPNILNMTDGAVTGITATFGFTATGVPRVAGANSDVEHKLRATFSSASGYKKQLTIPTILESVFQSSGYVDEANADWIAFSSFMEAGSGGVNPTDYRGDDIVGTVRAVEYFGKSRLK